MDGAEMAKHLRNSHKPYFLLLFSFQEWTWEHSARPAGLCVIALGLGGVTQSQSRLTGSCGKFSAYWPDFFLESNLFSSCFGSTMNA